MSDKLRVKRGSTTGCNGYTPEQGELLWDYTRGRLRVGNGTTAGGVDPDHTNWRARRHCAWYKDAGLTTATTVGMPAPVLSSVSGSVDTAGANGCPLLEHLTAGVGTAAGIINATPWLSVDWALEGSFRIRAAASVANLRLWCGFVNGSPDAVTDPGTLAMAALWYDTGVHGTATWRAVCSNGAGAGTYTQVDTGIAIASGSNHLWGIECTLDTEPIRFFHNGVPVATISTDVPASNKLLTPCHKVVQLTATARRCRWSSISVAHR